MRWIIIVALMGLAFMPLVAGAPQVLPASSATVFVVGHTDFIEFGNSGELDPFSNPFGNINILSPDGRQLTFSAQGIGCIDPTPARFTLSGTQIQGTCQWTVEGDLDNAPADGT